MYQHSLKGINTMPSPFIPTVDLIITCREILEKVSIISQHNITTTTAVGELHAETIERLGMTGLLQYSIGASHTVNVAHWTEIGVVRRANKALVALTAYIDG